MWRRALPSKMKVMKKLSAFIAFLAVAALLGLGWWWFTSGNQIAGLELGQIQQVTQSATKAVATAVKNVSAPEPLRAQVETPTANLTQAGVLKWTNLARRDNGGLPALTLNAKLNATAEAKLQDMFAKQYFEHVSPSGVGPGDLATRAGYAYLSEGENLALGNFADDQALVQAWMDSPGHRANILGKYSEIGLAVGRGTYEGESTWLAVQEFGRPLSACPQPDAALKTEINSDKASLAQLTAQAATLRAAFEASPKPHTQEQIDTYNAKVAEYNALAQQIRDLGQQINGEVTVYNGQVQAANACAGG